VLVAMMLTQAGLGIVTLYAVNDQIPLGLGLAHQGFAMLLLGMGSVHWRKLAV
jgi:cytochrome c oxidase assembly protein subunit 15